MKGIEWCEELHTNFTRNYRNILNVKVSKFLDTYVLYGALLFLQGPLGWTRLEQLTTICLKLNKID